MDAVVSQVRDIHIESYSPDKVHACESFGMDSDAFNCGMMGTVTTVITSDGNSRQSAKIMESPTIKRTAHRSSMLPQLRKLNLSKGYSADSTDNAVGAKGAIQSGLRLLDQFLSHDQRLPEKPLTATWNQSRNRSPTTSFNSHGRSFDGTTVTPSETQTPATSAASTPSMSKDEFDALPPTIQRKVRKESISNTPVSVLLHLIGRRPRLRSVQIFNAPASLLCIQSLTAKLLWLALRAAVCFLFLSFFHPSLMIFNAVCIDCLSACQKKKDTLWS